MLCIMACMCKFNYSIHCNLASFLLLYLSLHALLYIHNRYYDEGNKQIQERRINSRDVSTFAGKVETTGAKETPYFHEHDKIELDKDKRVQFSEGKAVLELGPEEEEKVSASSTKNDNDKGIPALGAMSDYKLRLSKCVVGPSKDDIATLSAALASHECTVDELLARIDDGK